MRIHEILLEKKHKKLSQKHHDDEVESPPEDPEQDKIPHIVMQLKKAVDVEGDYPVTFKDGKKVKLQLDDVKKFLQKYSMMKPDERENMQNMAAKDLAGFHNALQMSAKPPVKHQIKGTRYMSHFAGDHDEK